MRRRHWLLLGVLVAVVVLAAAGVIIWRYGMNHQEQMTLDQAGPVGERYAAAAVVHLPGSPRLVGPTRSSLPCDDPADHAPAGSADLALAYTLEFDQIPDPAQAFDQLKAYWVGQGYQIIDEDPATMSVRNLTAENPKDGFRIGLVRGDAGNFSLNVSSPCLMPGSPTP